MLGSMLMLVLEILASLLTGLLLMRGLVRALRISFINPLGQFLLTTTDWAVRPLQKLLPQLGRIDLSCWVPAWLVQAALVGVGTQACVNHLLGGPPGLATGIALVSLAGVVQTVIYLIMGAVLLAAVLSWVNPHAPIAPMVNALARPFLRPIARRLPPLGGLDLSPMVLLIALQLVLYLLAHVVPRPYFCS